MSETNFQKWMPKMSMIENLKEFLDSPEGKESLQKWADKIRRNDDRLEKAHNIIKERGCDFFDSLISREINKYTEEYRNKCYERGYEPYPTRITGTIFAAAGRYYDSIHEEALDEFDSHFGGGTVNYMGYQFNWIHGQGTVLRIFKDGEELLMI